MNGKPDLPLGARLSADIEHRPDRPKPYRARVRWIDPATGGRPSKSEAFATESAAQSWIDTLQRLANADFHATGPPQGDDRWPASA